MWFSKQSRQLRKYYRDLWHEAMLKITGWVFFFGGPAIVVFTDAIQQSYQYINGDQPTVYPQHTFMVSIIACVMFSLFSYPMDLIYKKIKGVRVTRDDPEPKQKKQRNPRKQSSTTHQA